MSIFLALLASGTTPVVMTQPDPHTMTQKEIRAYNAGLDKTDPKYIRCVRSAELGSLVKRNYSCRTNLQWAKSDRIGNDNARETSDAMTSKSWNQGN